MENKIMKGTPPMAMLPAKDYFFKVNSEGFEARMPRRGNYHALAPDFFSEDAGDFNIYDEKSKILYLPSITKVLFAISKYPALDPDQFLIPYIVKFEDDEVVLIGQIVTIVAVNDNKKDISNKEA